MPLGVPTLRGLLGDWKHRPGPAYLCLAGAIADRILDGRLAPGTRLPAERTAASAVGVSRRTIAAAYATLRERELVDSKRGSGNYVRRPADSEVAGGMPWAPQAPPLEAIAVDFGLAAPMRPHPAVGPALQRAAAGVDSVRNPGYSASGLLELREAVAQRYTDLGVPTNAGQILITGGAQQALDIVLRRVTRPGDIAVVEDPTYPAAIDALRARRARLAVIALAGPEWDLDEMELVIRRHHPTVVYVVPDFQMPTGFLMSDAQREELVRLTAGTTLVVDESLHELGFGSTRATPVAAYDDFERVVSIGSLSKPFWGGLRVGWIRANAELANELAHSKATIDLSGPYVEQRAAVDLITRLDDTLPAWLAQLGERRDVLRTALAHHLPSWELRIPEGGVVLWARAGGLPTDALARRARRFHLRLVGGSRFSAVGGCDDRMRLPFTLEPEELKRGVKHLAELVSWWDEFGQHELPMSTELTLAV